MKTDNELIAEFMGFGLLDETPVSKTKIFKLTDKNGDPIHPYYGPMRGEQMRFGSSWDWLMPVVEKINLIDKTSVCIYPSHCIISVDGTAQAGAHDFSSATVTAGILIKIVYLSVVNYIKWYNAQPK